MTWSELDPLVQLGLVVAIAMQLLLAAVALVVLFRTPQSRLLLGSRWPWVAIILVASTVGPVVFLAAGRRPAPAPDVVAVRRPAPEDVGRAVDALYGRPADPADEPDRRLP